MSELLILPAHPIRSSFWASGDMSVYQWLMSYAPIWNTNHDIMMAVSIISADAIVQQFVMYAVNRGALLM